MPEKNWKRFERSVARRLRGRRIPVTGERDGVDVDCGWLVVQAKARGSSKPVPTYLLEWLDSILRAAQTREDEENIERPLAVVVWQRARREPDGRALVIMTLDDFCDLHVGFGPTLPEDLSASTVESD